MVVPLCLRSAVVELSKPFVRQDTADMRLRSLVFNWWRDINVCNIVIRRQCKRGLHVRHGVPALPFTQVWLMSFIESTVYSAPTAPRDLTVRVNISVQITSTGTSTVCVLIRRTNIIGNRQLTWSCCAILCNLIRLLERCVCNTVQYEYITGIITVNAYLELST